MMELILNERMEKAQTESSLAKPNTDYDMNIDLSKEFLMELRSNAYYKTFDEDVVDHIDKVLAMLDLIKIPNVDSHRLRIKVFPLSLADDARQWWIDEGDGKTTTWKELVEKFFYKFYPLSVMAKMKCWRKDDIEKEDERSQKKRKGNNTILNKALEFDNQNNEQPCKRVCKAEKFEAIKYSLGPNEKYIVVRSCEYNAWERNKDSVSHIHQDIFHKKDKGWTVTRTIE
ncbi:hypothetical protein Tco_0741341 [Tanacetum coccineum]